MSDNRGRSRLGAQLLDRSSDVTSRVVDDVVSVVPEYRRFFASARGDEMRAQIETALRTFFLLVDSPARVDDAQLRPAMEAAAAMGRSEAVQGRDSHVVLNAFRAGGRAAWQYVVEEALARGMSGVEVAELAGSLFDFVDQISAATVSGHQAEVMSAQANRVRERDSLVRTLIASGAVDRAQADRAGWVVPAKVLLISGPEDAAVDLARVVSAADIVTTGQYGPGGLPVAVAVVAETSTAGRIRLLDRLDGLGVIVSPTVGLVDVPAAFRWCHRLDGSAGLADVDRALDAVLVGADPELAALLRARHLAPLATQNPGMRESLEQTLDAWLRHRGRQDRVAEFLKVHPQTIRYRLGRLRELLGETVDDPALTLVLLAALQASTSSPRDTPPSSTLIDRP